MKQAIEQQTEVTPIKSGDNITIIGRRWFDRINGNTYFSAVGLINGKEVVNIPFSYGYGEQYIYEVYKEMQQAGYMPDVEQYKNGGCKSLWQYAEDKGFTYYNTVSDVKRKKDL